MLEVYELAPATTVPLEMLRAASAAFAGWDELPDNEVILNRGIVEEAPECIAEMQKGDVDKLAVELGDMQWYISERARLAGLSVADICGPGVATLEDFQRQAVEEPAITPIWITADEALDPSIDPTTALSLLALRIADSVTMTEERLWRGHPDGIPMQRLLRDLFTQVAVVADSYGISLSYMLDRNVEKLFDRQRERQAHVLEDEQILSSSEEADDPEIAAQKARAAYAKKVARQREALGVTVNHLFVIDDYSDGLEQAA